MIELKNPSSKAARSVFDSSQTFYFPANVRLTQRVLLRAWGGGGGGLAPGGIAYGGGGGGFSEVIVLRQELPGSLALVIGAGGAGGVSSVYPPSAGGDTMVTRTDGRVLLVARGGFGAYTGTPGSGGGDNEQGTDPLPGSGGDGLIKGGAGLVSTVSVAPLPTIRAGAGGGNTVGGSSPFGGDGGWQGSPAQVPGGGGAANATHFDGAAGRIEIWLL